jgi:hypothetical protein
MLKKLKNEVKMKRILVLCLLTAIITSGCVNSKKETANLPAGVKAKTIIAVSEQWLKKLDDGMYSHGYDDGSAHLKTQVTLEKWLENMNAFRKPLGKPGARKEINMYYEQNMPGSPEGEYVVVQYGTVYLQRDVIIETVVLIKEPDGVWRASGYFMK